MGRGQLSLEFLVYLSLAGLSLLFATSVLGSVSPGLRNSLGYYATSVLVERINDAVLSGTGNQNLSGFLPSGICNSSISKEGLSTKYGNFSFTGEIEFAPNVFCPDNQVAKFNLEYGAEQAELFRVG